MRPSRLDLLCRSAHAGQVDLAIAGVGAHDDGELVSAAAAVDDVGDEERLALVLFHAAHVLPADQRMQLGVLVDRPVYGEQQAPSFQRVEMLMQVGVAAGGLAATTDTEITRPGLA